MCQNFWWLGKRSFNIAFWRLILLLAMRSESVRWKEGTRCQFSGLCPRVQCRTQSHAQCRTSHSLSHEPNSSPVTCQLANINMGASRTSQSFHPNLLWHQPWSLTTRLLALANYKTSKWASMIWTESFPNVLPQWPSSLHSPPQHTPPLSCHFGWRSESSNVARAERLHWCAAAAHICGTRST